jgi:hypothetical protein
MKLRIFALCSLGLSACLAQQFEFGGAAGAGFPRGSSVTAPTGTASAGLKNGPAFGVVLGHRMYPRIGGEVRYSFLKNDLRLASGESTTFGAQAHALHYDLLFHARKADAPVQPFVAAGGGMKIFRGTGREAAYQPLSQYAYLTKTQEVKPMLSVGAGVRVRISPRVWLRTEFRDYVTPFPKKVITPARGAKLNGGWVHNIVPMAGVSYIF